MDEGLRSYDPNVHRFVGIRQDGGKGMRYRAFEFKDFPRPPSKNDFKKSGSEEIEKELFGKEGKHIER